MTTTETPTLRPKRAAAAHLWRPDIQGLRALAVLLVVLSHAGVRQLRGGYVGVDVFFVISGFLITSSLARELSATGGISIRAFYARRALRLLPASTLVLVSTLAGAWLFLSKVRFTDYVNDAFGSALYFVNIRLASTGTDYLAQGAPPSPFQHFWSLAVEEQFYLLWPLLLLASWTAARRRRRLLAVPLAVLCLISLALSVATTASSASWAYFGPQTRLWELGAGSLVALFAARLEQLSARISAPLTWIGVACVLLSALRFDENTRFPGYDALLPVLGAVLVVAGGCAPAPLGARWLLARRPMTWLGGLSYGWYLWHWPLVVIGPMALNRPATVPLALELSAVALLLAWVTLHAVENRVRFHRAFRGRPVRGLGAGLGLSAGAVAATLVAGAFPPAIDSGVPAASLKTTLAAAPNPEARLAELLESAGTRLPSNLAPPITAIKATRSAVYRDGCHVNYDSTRTPPCVYGDRSSDTVVVLFGDSHAAQWFPAMDLLARTNHWKLISLTKASCKTAAVTIVNGGRPYRACDVWRNKVLARIDALRPSLVIVSSSEAGTPAREMRDPLKEWTAGYQDTFQRIAAGGARVAALLDTPWPKADAVDCAATYPLRLGRCATQVSEAFHDPMRRSAVKGAAKATGTAVIDPAPWLCARTTGVCPVVVGDNLVYRDDSHIAEAYARAIAPVLGGRLAAILGAP